MEENTPMIDTEFDIDLSDVLTDEAAPTEETTEEVVEEVQEEPTEQVEEDPAAEDQNTDEQPTEEKPQEETPTDKPAEDDFYTLNILGQSQKISKKPEEVVPILQKGMDYDRVHGQRDELRTQVKQLTEESAKNSGIIKHLQGIADQTNGGDLDALVKSLRIGAVARQRGLDTHNADQYRMAQRIVENQDVEATLAANQAKQAEEKKASDAEAQNRARMERDLSEFQAAHPDIYQAVDTGKMKIAPEVWAMVRYGVPLTKAYDQWAATEALKKQNEELSAKAAAAKQNETNRQRSVGSATTSGQSKNTDKFLIGFDMEA